MIQVVVKKVFFLINPDELMNYYFFCSQIQFRFLRSSIPVYLPVTFLTELQPFPRSIHAAEHNNFPVFFLRNIFHPTSSINFDLKSNILLSMFLSRGYPPPPPLVTYIYNPPFSISPSFFLSGLRNPSYPTNTPSRV